MIIMTVEPRKSVTVSRTGRQEAATTPVSLKPRISLRLYLDSREGAPNLATKTGETIVMQAAEMKRLLIV